MKQLIKVNYILFCALFWLLSFNNVAATPFSSNIDTLLHVQSLLAVPQIIGPTSVIGGQTYSYTSSDGPGIWLVSNGQLVSYNDNSCSIKWNVGSTSGSVAFDGQSGRATKNVTISSPPAGPTVTVIQPTCTVSTGTISITPLGTGYNYAIDGGTNFYTSSTFSSLSPGTYNVVSRNSSGVISQPTVTTINAAPATPAAPSCSLMHPACYQGSGSISVTSPVGTGYTYAIDGGSFQSAVLFSNVTSGLHTITAKNSSGCTSSANVTINAAPSQITFTTSQVNVTCNGGNNGSITIMASGGNGVFQYSKDNGSTWQASNNFTGLSMGSYTINVKDGNSCVATGTTINITQPSVVSWTTSIVNITCNGGNNGAITVTASGGNGSFQYSKDNGTTWQASNSFTGLTAGYYSVKVKDGNNCTSTETLVSITQPAMVSWTTSQSNVTCNGGNNGSIIVTATGGNETFQYSKDNGITWQASNSFTGLSVGSYIVKVKDGNNCTGIGTAVSIIQPVVVSWTITPVNVTCNGGNNGSLTVTATGGNGTYQYSKDNGITWQASNSFIGLTAGSYTVKVIDGNNCSATGTSVSVSQPAVLAAGTISGNQTIFVGSSPSFSQTAATGGSGLGTYQWQQSTDNLNWANISGATAATYISPALSGSTYFRRNVIDPNCGTVATTAILVTVVPHLGGGTVTSGKNQIIPYNTVPSTIVAAAATGGNGGGVYAYQWQSSTDNVSYANIIGATAQNLTFSQPLQTTSYFKRSVSSGSEITYTDVATVTLPNYCQPLASAPSNNQNYISALTMQVAGVTNTSQLSNLSTCDVTQTVQYFDGLGRPLQTIQTKGSAQMNDLVQAQEFDQLGREVKKYLPYSSNVNNGSYKVDALLVDAGVSQFYAQAGKPYESTSVPFAETIMEASPLNTIIEQGAPGVSWQVIKDASGTSLQTGNTVKTDNNSNIDSEVKLWTLTVNGATSAYYAKGQLFKTIIKDENWKSVNDKVGTVEEFKEQDGRIILKRSYNKNDLGVTEVLSTYYVYDEFNNLKYVVPPAVSINSFTESDQVFSDFIYAYRYDGRKRVTEKKIPGKDWDYLVYNNKDQVVYTQDGNQRAKTPTKEWSFVKYDGLGRIILTGTISSDETRSNLQAIISNQQTSWEVKGNTHYGYTNNVEPKLGMKVLTANYYDDYTFPVASSYPYETDTLNLKSSMTKGLLTGNMVKVLNTPDSLWTVNYYDDEGRIIQQHSQNYVGGKDVINTKYSFTGQPLVVKRVHTGLGSLTVINWYQYDHMGRKLQELEKVNNEPRIILADYNYNELGQLITKRLHSTDRGANYIQTVDYSYTIRGWLKKINDLSNVNTTATGDRFAMELKYDDGTTPQFNGNIAAMNWKGAYSNQSLSYNFSYDALNRLKNAISHDGTYSEAIGSYDLMGNIQSLARSNNVDNLTYSYSGNRLTSVVESLANNMVGQRSGTTNYSQYDANGNLTATTGATPMTIAYNVLNLPHTITVGGGTITYTYDANGNKLKKVAGGITTNYVNGIQYNGNTIDFVQTSEGRVTNKTSFYDYSYNLTDHLGNTRVVVDKTGDLIQEDNYYPFGMEIPDPLKNISSSPKNKYLYNGKELQDEYGLNQYDYGARFYDPVIGRWNVVDPMAEKMRNWSPYTYTFNNPIRFIDVGGEYPWPVHIRSFISTSTTGGGLFRGDGRGPSFVGTSRVRSSFIVDPSARSVSQPITKSDPTIFYGVRNPTGVGFDLPPAVKTGSPEGTNDNINFRGNKASFDFSHSGKDPLTPGFATPSLDVHASLSFNEDLKNEILTITGSFTGDTFPSAEAFITDQSGKTKVFLGAKMENGGLGDLYGDNKEFLFNVNMQIKFDDKGNFTGVQVGKKIYTIEDWNKKVQEDFKR